MVVGVSLTELAEISVVVFARLVVGQ